jgi:hypothetical protein
MTPFQLLVKEAKDVQQSNVQCYASTKATINLFVGLRIIQTLW